MLTTLPISFTEQHPFLPAYSPDYAVLNIVGIIIIINSIRIRAGVFLQLYRKHYCVTKSRAKNLSRDSYEVIISLCFVVHVGIGLY